MSTTQRPAAEDILWQEGTRDCILLSQGDSQESCTVQVRAMVWNDNKKAIAGMEVSLAGKSDFYAMTIATPTPLDLFHVHRYMQEIERISPDIFRGIAYALKPHLNPDFAAFLPQLVGAMGQGVYEAIATQVPDNFCEIMAFFNAHGIPWSREGMTKEIADGKYPYSIAFQAYGVETPDVMEQRHQAEMEFLRPLLPHFTAFSLAHPEPDLLQLSQAAIQLIPFQITDVADLVTGSIVFAQALVHFEGHFTIPFGSQTFLFLPTKGVTPKQVIAFLAQHFQSENAAEHERRLERIVQSLPQWAKGK